MKHSGYVFSVALGLLAMSALCTPAYGKPGQGTHPQSSQGQRPVTRNVHRAAKPQPQQWPATRVVKASLAQRQPGSGQHQGTRRGTTAAGSANRTNCTQVPPPDDTPGGCTGTTCNHTTGNDCGRNSDCGTGTGTCPNPCPGTGSGSCNNNCPGTGDGSPCNNNCPGTGGGGSTASGTKGGQQSGNVRGQHGPYARIDRANEVANYYRNRGYNARVVYLKTVDDREYAVDVW